MARSGSDNQPGDAPRGRPGWSGGGRKRADQRSWPEQPPPPPADRGPRNWRSVPPSAHRPGPQAPPPPPPTQQPTHQQSQPFAPHERYDRHGQSRTYAGYEPPTRPVPPQQPPPPPADGQQPSGPRVPKKLTVTRVAAYRSRQLTQQAVNAFQRAAHADGARESGLTSLTYAVMLNYASSATMAVGLANTLFFSAATAESKTKVALYLLITVAPFALIAPVIGPMLDRVQRGRRIALAVSCVGQGLLSVVMALHFNDWLLYPAALGTMVLSKSFDVLKAAVTPRVLPSGITLSKTNARLTVFGLGAGMTFGALGSGCAKLFGSPGALWFTALLCLVDAWLCLRIPAWVEVTEGEVPASLRSGGDRPRKQRQPMGQNVVVGLWGNGTIRLLTGFLMLFPAFVIKSMTEHSAFKQLLLLGVIGAAAGLGSFIGNAVGARLQFGRPDQVILYCVGGSLVGAVVAAVLPGIGTAAIGALIAATASGLAKISLDATIQNDLPEASRASAFGRSETILQLSWVFGGALGVLLPTEFWIGFTVVSALLAAGLAQTVFARRGHSLVPNIRALRRPSAPEPPGAAYAATAAEPPAGPGGTRTMPSEPDGRP